MDFIGTRKHWCVQLNVYLYRNSKPKFKIKSLAIDVLFISDFVKSISSLEEDFVQLVYAF